MRYVPEGSLRKVGNRIRVTAQLVEAESGKHVWAERYDRDLTDIFALQDEITEAVTVAIAPAIADAEQQRAIRKPPGNLDAWAAYQRGLWHMSKATAGDNALAQKFFQQAIDLDPAFAGGYWGFAAAHMHAAAVFQTSSLPDARSSMEALARRAVALDGSDAEARSWLGQTLFMFGDHKGALAESERALAMSQNLTIAHETLAIALTYSGRPKVGLAALQRYLRLDPRDPTLAAGVAANSSGALLLPRVRDCARSGGESDPGISRFSAFLSLARCHARPAWANRRSKECARKGYRSGAHLL